MAKVVDGFYETRELSRWMLDQMTKPHGVLHPILLEVQRDPDLDLQIRRHYFNVYYRGGNLMEVHESRMGRLPFRASFHQGYTQGKGVSAWRDPPNAAERKLHEDLRDSGLLTPCLLSEQAETAGHVDQFGQRKEAMDANKKPGRRPKAEREAAQVLVRASNAAASNDYLICDIEYSFPTPEHAKNSGRIDLVAARRPDPGDPDARCRLVLVELKHGINAIDGAAGLRTHMDDLRVLMGDGSVARLREEMRGIVRQKHELGLMRTTALYFDPEAPLEYVVAVVAHNNRSQRLRDALLGRWHEEEGREGRLTPPDGLDVRIAVFAEDPLGGRDCVLRRDEMLRLDDITSDDVPDEIFAKGRPVRQRPWKKDYPSDSPPVER